MNCHPNVPRRTVFRKQIDCPRDSTDASPVPIIPFLLHTAYILPGLFVAAFVAVRLTELLVYPPVAWLAKLPTYKSSDWVNLSLYLRPLLEGLPQAEPSASH